MANTSDFDDVCAACGERFASAALLGSHVATTHPSTVQRGDSGLRASIGILGLGAIVVVVYAFAWPLAVGLTIAGFVAAAIGRTRPVLLAAVLTVIAVLAVVGEVLWLRR